MGFLWSCGQYVAFIEQRQDEQYRRGGLTRVYLYRAEKCLRTGVPQIDLNRTAYLRVGKRKQKHRVWFVYLHAPGGCLGSCSTVFVAMLTEALRQELHLLDLS